ncbi:uncharacterized protein PV07_10495 [Cladophialophora immunda]|uniref:ferric-chelate reductase (NADPH) n=1 Tax=Cladophialophora immunda TaxID=569365 RepID=A0A0D2CML0_9EURO|nr:uncharacterized protein PV07_10495 [Cladophialophora immunda]KIW24804.1 hypothetical protein PV07_10495 [Cladophialophora immunda]
MVRPYCDFHSSDLADISGPAVGISAALTFRFLLSISEFEIIFVLIYVAANTVCMSLNVKDHAEVAARSGTLATINLVPLLVGTQLSDVADFLGVALHVPKIIHRWISCMTLLEGSIHIVINIRAARLKWSTLEICGTIAFGALTTAAVLSVSCSRRYFYEMFLGLHVGTTGVAAIALWRHLSVGHFEARFYILGGIAFWGCWLLVGSLIDCYYNINLGQGNLLPRANIVTDYRTEKGDQVVMADACHLEILVNRDWDVQPGDYLFISLPGLGFPSLFQRHPFWITWWETDNGVMKLDMLVRKRRGFTRRLLSHREQECTAWISRPFGRSENFGDYGSVLMFAADVGITAHLPYLKWLMKGRLEASIRTRRVVIIWQVEDYHDKWVKKWFDKLLPNDTSFMLEIRIHCPNNGRYQPASGSAHPIDLFPGDVLAAGEHDLVKLIARPAHFEQILGEERFVLTEGREPP